MTDKFRVLITGGAGFIGSRIARAWAARGAHVVILDSLRTGKRSNLDGLDCQFIEASVEDRAAVRDAMEGARYVHHLAALVSVPESMEKIDLCESINAGGTLNVLQAARDAGVRKVVFSSTSAVYGMAERPIHRETDRPEPASPYAITKLAAEHYMDLFNGAFGLPTASLRYFNVYGAGQDPDSPYAAVIASFGRRIEKGETLSISGDGGQTRDFIHVKDVVAANLLAAENDSVRGVYNVACGHQITVNELASRMIELSGSSTKIAHLPPRAGDVRDSRGDASRLMALGWKPEIQLENGLRELVSGTAAQKP